MSEYRFEDWSLVASKKAQQDPKCFEKELFSPKVDEFLDHHQNEVSNALGAGVVDDARWNNLLAEISKSVNALDLYLERVQPLHEAIGTIDLSKDSDPNLINLLSETISFLNSEKLGNSKMLKAFYDLGRAREALDHPTLDERLNLYKKTLSTIKRERPLMLKNSHAQHARDIAQIIAQKRWYDDTEQTIRIGAMCKIVHTEIITNHKGFIEIIPEEPVDMKPWLRPIAPEWAKKGGRPRKKSKK